ncbi:granulocyte-macrophage colony-stimulating factor receptor subunit alpha isoform X4 [Mus musculus]|uniref:granulocyte-macrophage colony-stimulating factor receptor subunit alpha isoform X4 n=1 Tax=Mus musculus TaxID=10090 RepID=UPI0007ECFCF5|nr:granulocyte-macrophage colony-stimulating factor receptor subunit alpha isoform X4 [Mus musculus]|eukprot:XP_017173541.1 PREDICTED: granulocyte-macrophage colony-stimulating factor receptor subunit alpha isoform X5 [Mus musculus]
MRKRKRETDGQTDGHRRCAQASPSIAGSPLSQMTSSHAMNITPLAQLALLFSTLLLPGTQALLAPTTPDAGSALNLTFDPWTRTLTWACDTAAGNVTVTSCTVTSREAGIHRRVSPFGCRCWFRRMMALHHGVTLDVNGTVGGAAAHWRLSFVNEGAAGSGAENLTCEIRAARFLSCAWREGPAAPADVRYSLRVLNSTGHDVARCMADPGDDVITQCIANDLSLLGSEAYLVVTGRSGAGPVRFLDDVVATKALERLGPPRDVTASCNSSHCTVSWAPPSTWASLTARDFQFEVQWQVLVVEETRLAFPSPAPHGGHKVKVRAGDTRMKHWGEWSPAHPLEAEDTRVPGALLYAVTACAVLLCALALGVTCRRFEVTRRLFPPIPGIRDKVSDDVRVNPETLRKDLLQP